MKETITALQKQLDKAELQGDREVLGRLLAEDFLAIGPKGFVLNKREWINRHELFKYHELNTSEVDVRLYDKTAIVRNVQQNRAVYQGELVAVATRVMQVWVENQGQWQLAGIQFSPLDTGG